jgi:hypothetical protein
MFITTFAQNYMREMPFHRHKILKIERGQPHAPDPQRNAQLLAKIKFPNFR